MSNFYKRKVAQESANGTPAEDNLSNVETPEENLETNLEELASEDSQLDTLMRDGETLDSDMEKTEDAITDAEDAMDDGEELSENSAESLEIGQESVRKRWGIQRTRVARESFRDNRGATRIAHEGWKETLKDLWSRLLSLVESMLARAKDLKLKVMNIGKSAVSRSKKYEDALSNLGTKKKKDTISGGWMSKLALEGDVKPIECGELAVQIVGGGKSSAAISALNAQIEAAAQYSVADGDDGTKFSAGNKDIEFVGEVAKKLKVLPGFEAESGGNIEPHRVFALPGNAYVQSATKTLVTGAKGEESKLTMVAYFSAGDKAEQKDISTPSLGDMRKANTQLKKIGENYEKVLNDFRKQDATLGKLKEAVKKTISNFDKSKEENRNHLRAARQIASAALTSTTAVNKAIHGTARNVISGLSGYIGAGIGAYEKA